MGGWPGAFYCQPQSLLVLDLIGTWLGLGLGGLGTGLDNNRSLAVTVRETRCCDSHISLGPSHDQDTLPGSQQVCKYSVSLPLYLFPTTGDENLLFSD